jgi:NTE family protein
MQGIRMNTTTSTERRIRGIIRRRPVGLALQGGGSWGAYTWGALDALLASRKLAVVQLSGASAGAINAAIVASALAKGTPAQARRELRSFWLCMAEPAAADLVRSLWGPLGRTWRDSLSDWLLASAALPSSVASAVSAQALRDAVAAHVDIDAIRGKSAPALFVTVTNVKTGLPRVISNHEMSIDVLLASACLPHLFPAVELDGEHYWDGGYAGNPPLWPMIQSGLADDIVLVQLVPDRTEDVPVDRPAIRRRVSEIVFNASLVAEIQALRAMRSFAARDHGSAHVGNIRLHRVGPPHFELFEEGNGYDRGRAWLKRLHEHGLGAAKDFVATHGADIGVRETLDIGRVFFDDHKPRIPVASSKHPLPVEAV